MFRDRFVRQVARTGGKKLPVVVAIAREMLCLMYSIARERRHYTVEPPSRPNRRTKPAA